jgi:uncharacterized protein (TIGR04255 family)
MIFSNPPLVELVAELRWVPGVDRTAAPPQPQGGNLGLQVGTIQFPLTSPYQEEIFSRFSNHVAAKGFVISERLVPSGFPALLFTVVYRFRKPSPTGENYLYQIGPGLFSANALPPYRNWDSFRPIVQEGIQALLDSRHPTEAVPFTSIKLGYIDLFTAEFTEGKRSFRFLNDVLGVKLELPNTLKEQISDIDGVQAGVHLAMPLRNGLVMNLNFQDGIVAGKSGILMSTEVLAIQPTPPDISQIMQTLENAHTHIRATFLGLTEKLSAKMLPVQ